MAVRNYGVNDAVSPLREEDVLFSRKEAARMLRISIATLDRWHALGEGPASVRVGARRLYRLSELRRFVNEGSAR